MGGCRCTYRNCSLRTDGKTHMFHYPVFDKVRCHQWLTNAHKLEFLNLKVSQLKNRVVCQYHFKDEYFMNFKKDKLTFDAVPTEDGPYCDSSQWKVLQAVPDDTKGYSISLDDIENEYMTISDKKANFSVKYGDFLTNCDIMDSGSLGRINTSSKQNTLDLCPNPHIQTVKSKDPNVSSGNKIYNNRVEEIGNPTNNILNVNSNKQNTIDYPPNTFTETDTRKPQEEIYKNHIPFMYNVEIEQLNELNNLRTNQCFDTKVDTHTHTYTYTQQINQNTSQTPKEKKKICIISEKKISNHLPLLCKPDPDKLEPVSLNRVLTLPKKNKKVDCYPANKSTEFNTNNNNENVVQQTDNASNNVLLSNNLNIKEIIVEIPSELTNVTSNKPDNVQDENYQNNNNCITVDTTENLKKYVGSDQSANIPEEVKSQPANNMDKRNNTIINTNPDKRKLSNSRRCNVGKPNNSAKDLFLGKGKVSLKKNNSNSLLKINNREVSPKTHVMKKIPPERVAAIAEKRQFNMKLRDIVEGCLDKLDEPDKALDKNKCQSKPMLAQQETVITHLAQDPELPNIDNYTIAYLEARIKKMENNLINKIDKNAQRISELKSAITPTRDKKNSHTQTSLTEIQHKKQLYQEISKYISKEANSLLYEELFINKFKPRVPKSTPSPKRRKYR